MEASQKENDCPKHYTKEHDFFAIKRDVLYVDGVEVKNSIHTVVGCAYCGQIRLINLEGVTIVKENAKSDTGNPKKARFSG